MSDHQFTTYKEAKEKWLAAHDREVAARTLRDAARELLADPTEAEARAATDAIRDCEPEDYSLLSRQEFYEGLARAAIAAFLAERRGSE